MDSDDIVTQSLDTEPTMDSNDIVTQSSDAELTMDSDDIVLQSLDTELMMESNDADLVDNADQVDCLLNAAQANAQTIHNATHMEDQSMDSSPLDTKTRILSPKELYDLIFSHALNGNQRIVVGLVGYPNVGKSSTINALVGEKKVNVSATPGKTKHFQTIVLTEEVTLCDCPGLVFPSFAVTKADMVVNGILPIDHLRECWSPSAIVAQQIPRYYLESVYGISLPQPTNDEDPDRCPTATELLSAFAGIVALNFINF